MISGVFVGYLVVLGLPIVTVALLIRATFARVKIQAEAHKIAMDADYQEFVEEFPAAVEPWTAAERELLGVNDTDDLIARIDAELMTPEERERIEAARPKQIIQAGTIDASMIRTDTFAWGRSMPVRTILTHDDRVPVETFKRDSDGVWIQQ